MTTITIRQTAEILNISDATVRNWVKHGHLSYTKYTKNKFLRTDILLLKQRIDNGKLNLLRKRANKRKSGKTFAPREYIHDMRFIRTIENIREIFRIQNLDLETSLFVLALKQLALTGEVFHHTGLNVLDIESHTRWMRDSVRREMYSWSQELHIDKTVNAKGYKEIYEALLCIDHNDTLGVIYQSLLLEGCKSLRGSYYTPQDIVDDIFTEHFVKGKRYLDPCCGTGQFLLGAVRAGYSDPALLYGYDIDSIAVHISRINLFSAFPKKDFAPQVYKTNTLIDIVADQVVLSTTKARNKFHLIATNPPWGSARGLKSKNYRAMYPHITSGESFSLFLSKCIDLSEEGGLISLILPESVLNIKTHADIRKDILQRTSIKSIQHLGRRFHRVFTPAIRLDLIRNRAPKGWTIDIKKKGRKTYKIRQARFNTNENFLFDVLLSNEDLKICSLLYERDHITLKNNATWALGIVTGNNKKYIRKTRNSEMEPIYTGADVDKYRLKKPSSFIKYQPELFQQVAPESKYRATEKLIYRFISKKLVFAYDTTGSLTLNSANILLPKIKNYPSKLILAFSNSSLYQFMFAKKFNTHKILRGDLEKFPFPLLRKKDRSMLISLVEKAIDGKDVQDQLDREIMRIMGLSAKQIDVVNNNSLMRP